jgi:hypothetical protein
MIRRYIVTQNVNPHIYICTQTNEINQILKPINHLKTDNNLVQLLRNLTYLKFSLTYTLMLAS